jgi:hypothetical protein
LLVSKKESIKKQTRAPPLLEPLLEPLHGAVMVVIVVQVTWQDGVTVLAVIDVV